MKVSLNTIKQYIDFELPPVGEVCEMKHKHSTADWARPGFEPVVIVASGKDLFIVSGTDVYRETVGSWDEYEFRPIRTERDVLIEIIKKTDDTDDRIADAILAAGFKRGIA